MKRFIFALMLLLPLAACEGPVGPQGPAGPTGPAGAAGEQGPAGEDGGAIWSASGTFDNDGLGAAVIENANIEEIAVNCWVSEDGIGWILVALNTDSDNEPLACAASQQDNDVLIGISGGTPGFFWLIVAIL